MEVSRVDRLNRVIHEPARLGIMSVLAAQPELSFTEVRAHLDMTDGNLSVHLRILEEAGYVSIEKKFVDRKPRTTVRLAKKGRIAFEHYVDVLREIVEKK